MATSSPIARSLTHSVALFAPFVLLSVLSAGPATAQVTFFRANFDLDTPGAEPALSPPGEPDGDTLTLYTTGGSILVQQSVGSLTTRPLVLTKPNANTVAMWGTVDPALDPCDQYTVRWRVMARQTDAYMGCNVHAANGRRIAGIGFYPGGSMSYFGIGNGLSTTYATDVAMLLEVTIDTVARTTSLSIDGTPVPEAQDQPYNDSGASDPRDVETNGFSTPLGTFVVDDVEVIGSQCPGTNVDADTWGRIKAIYR